MGLKAQRAGSCCNNRAKDEGPEQCVTEWQRDADYGDEKNLVTEFQ